MISKRKLRERLLDILMGAGMEHCEDNDCEWFDFHDDDLACVGRAIQAIERSFSIPENSALRLPWQLHCFSDIDKLTDLVHASITPD